MKNIFEHVSDNIKTIDIEAFWIDFIEHNIAYEDKILQSQRDRIRIKGLDIFKNEIRTHKAITPNVYTGTTIGIKQAQNKPYKHVTLTDSGSFLNKELELITQGREAKIGYDDTKPDGKISDNVDLSNVFGWTDEDMEVLANFVTPLFIEYLTNKILHGV